LELTWDRVDLEVRRIGSPRIVANGKRATAAHHNTVNSYETGRYAAKPETVAAIRKALEKAGVEFTDGRKPLGVRSR
jgi:hypothetical protein